MRTLVPQDPRIKSLYLLVWEETVPYANGPIYSAGCYHGTVVGEGCTIDSACMALYFRFLPHKSFLIKISI